MLADAPDPGPDDAALLARLRAGDEAAFAGIVRTWSPAMLRVARAHVRTHASAEEVVQEAWLGVIRGLARFEGRAKLRTWVFRILVNVARRRGRAEDQPPVPLDAPTVDSCRFPGNCDTEYPGHWRAGTAPTESGPENALLTVEFRTLLATALAELPERQRAVVELRDVHGLDGDQVCELLHLTAANQRVLLHRGRSRLRALFEAGVA